MYSQQVREQYPSEPVCFTEKPLILHWNTAMSLLKDNGVVVIIITTRILLYITVLAVVDILFIYCILLYIYTDTFVFSFIL